jgi:hypothetical protein
VDGAVSSSLTLEEAVAGAPGRKVVVTGEEVRDGKRVVMIDRVGRDGYEQLAWAWVAVDEIDGLVATWTAAHGVEVALTEEYCQLIWVVSADGVEVFDGKHEVLEAVGERAVLADGKTIARADIAGVFAWSTDDYIYRAVKATLRSGGEVALVDEASSGAMAGAEGWPVYSRNEYLVETVWCVTLGRAIAAWAGVELENRLV